MSQLGLVIFTNQSHLMDISDLSERLASELSELGWHVNTKQSKCPNRDCHSSQSFEPTKSYCPYCGVVLETDKGGIADMKQALGKIDAVAEAFGGGEAPVGENVMRISIPAVMDPKGRINAMYWQNAEGENRTDEALLYDHWVGKEDVPLRKIRIGVKIDLGAVFENSSVEGTVTNIEDPE